MEITASKLSSRRSGKLAFYLIIFTSAQHVLPAQEPPANNVTYFTDPIPSVSSFPQPNGTVEVVLHKELSGYPNYGVTDGRSDILYTGEVATWTFTLPSSVDPATIRNAFFRTSLIADDHYNVDLGAYRLAAWTNRKYLGDSPANLPHGIPYGTRFSNWVQRDYPITVTLPSYSITLFNTSGVGNWFAVDWIELHLITGTVQTGKAISGIVPPRGGNQGNVTVIIEGVNFPGQIGSVSARLTATGKPALTGLFTEQISSTQIITTFDLRGAPPGFRDLTVGFSDGTSASINAAFEVLNGGGSVTSVDLIGPSVARVNRDTSFIAVLTNIGLNDTGMLSLQAEVNPSASLTGSVRSFAAAAPGALNAIVGGLAPGASIALPFIARFQNCSNINLSSKEEPNTCEELMKEKQRLQEEVNALHVQITLLEAKIAFVQSQIDACKCESLAPLCSLAQCADLLIQRQWLRNELARHRLSLAEVLRRLKAICARIEEECGPQSSSLRSPALVVRTANTGSSTQRTICPVFSWDPNDKNGPAGAGPAKHIRRGIEVPYTVFFENKAVATAPAQDVSVTDQLDSDLDWSTLSLGTIKFGNRVVQPPEGVQNFTTTVDLRPAQNLLVKIGASLNPLTGVLIWRFTSLDPSTGQPPVDPLSGFLPPNKIPPQGEGSLAYKIRIKSTLATGTAVTNRARIVFDIDNPPIDTPEWSNVVDASPPSSKVLALAPVQGSQSFTVQWQATDVGSGVLDSTIYVSDNAGPFVPWLIQTTASQATFTGQPGHIYSFFSVARDLVGHQENVKTSAEASTAIGVPQCSANLTGQFSIARSGFRLNNTTGRFLQSVTLTNRGPAIALPLAFVLDKLSATAALFNKTGSTLCAVPLGSPLISVGAPNTILPSSGTISVTLDFLNPSNAGIVYELRLLGSGGTQ